MTVDACRVCGAECSYCADKRRAAKTQGELDALREMNDGFAQAMAARRRPIVTTTIGADRIITTSLDTSLSVEAVRVALGAEPAK